MPAILPLIKTAAKDERIRLPIFSEAFFMEILREYPTKEVSDSSHLSRVKM
jgi:hypothetical protein